MAAFKILIAEDDEWYANFLEYQLDLIPEYEIHTVNSGQELHKQLSTIQPDLITLDYNLPDTSGESAFEMIQRDSPDTPIIIISGQENIEVAVDFLRKGAEDYIVKNVETKERLWKAVSSALEKRELKSEIQELRKEIGKKFDFSKSLIGNSKEFKSIFHLLEKASKSSINVSITGETGTGKEMIAKAIHFNSDRKNSPFVAVNVAAIPKELIESELFGHEKGAFTCLLYTSDAADD